MEAFVAEGSRTVSSTSREEGERREEGDTRQREEEEEASPEDMDALMEVVAEAISQTEREAAAAQGDATTDVRGMREAEATRNKEVEREAESRRRAEICLQAMGNHGGAQSGETGEEGTASRRGKEPSPSATHAADGLTPPAHKVHQHTPSTRPYGGPGPSRFRPTTP